LAPGFNAGRFEKPLNRIFKEFKRMRLSAKLQKILGEITPGKMHVLVPASSLRRTYVSGG